MLKGKKMKRIDDHFTKCFWEPWEHLGEQRLQMMEKSWAGVFRQYLLKQLPVEKIARRFDDHNGRPSKELYAMLGVMILQQTFDLTDAETEATLAFDIRWHYALDIKDGNGRDMCVSERTLRNYRSKAIELKIDELLFGSLTDVMMEIFGGDGSKQRVDSTHFHSNMKNQTRVEMFRKVLENFLQNLPKRARKLYDHEVSTTIKERYGKAKKNQESAVKPSGAKAKLAQLGADIYVLVERFKNHPTVVKMKTYGHLCRVLQEQCEIVAPENQAPLVQVKDPGELGGGNMLNPSDPEAGYSRHKGRGYQAQIMETYREEESGKKPETEADLITYVKVESASRSDMKALPEAIKETQARGCGPKKLLADGGYGSDANEQMAASAGVKLVSPSGTGLAGNDDKLRLHTFEFNEDGNIKKCPAGEVPTKTSKGKSGWYQTWFEREKCGGCELRERCIVKIDSKQARLPRYGEMQIRLAERRNWEKTADYREHYRWRAGVEATMSRLKQQVKIARVRVRGMEPVRFVVTLKVLGLNLKRCARAQAARMRPPRGGTSGSFFILRVKITEYLRRQINIAKNNARPIFGALIMA